MSDWSRLHNRIVWVDIPVVELERAMAFYSAVLGIEVSQEQFGEIAFAVLAHSEGNGACLVVKPDEVARNGGLLVYLNCDGRIRTAVEQVGANGGEVLEDVHSIGPHGFRALVRDSEGNRVALHSDSDA